MRLLWPSCWRLQVPRCRHCPRHCQGKSDIKYVAGSLKKFATQMKIILLNVHIGGGCGTDSFEAWTNPNSVWREGSTRTETCWWITFQCQREATTGHKEESLFCHKYILIFNFYPFRWYTEALCHHQRRLLKRVSVWWRRKRHRTLASGASKFPISPLDFLIHNSCFWCK